MQETSGAAKIFELSMMRAFSCTAKILASGEGRGATVRCVLLSLSSAYTCYGMRARGPLTHTRRTACLDRDQDHALAAAAPCCVCGVIVHIFDSASDICDLDL